MKVGDLVISKGSEATWYGGRYFIIIDMMTGDHRGKRNLIKCYSRQYQTKWCDAATWEVVSESR